MLHVGAAICRINNFLIAHHRVAHFGDIAVLYYHDAHDTIGLYLKKNWCKYSQLYLLCE